MELRAHHRHMHPAKMQLYLLPPPTHTHHHVPLSPIAHFHVKFNICERVWQGAFVPAWHMGDPRYLRPPTPHEFLLGLNNSQVRGVHPARKLLGKEKEKKKPQHLQLDNNNSPLIFLSYILCKDADSLLISWLSLFIEINVLFAFLCLCLVP